MRPDALRSASTAMLCMGIAATVALFLDFVYPLAAWGLILGWIAFALALDFIAEKAQRANKNEVDELRRRGL